jgi:hypothetical protein
VEHHGLGVGVVEQIDQLVGDVAIVGVDRDEARLERREIGLEVFGGVVEIGRDLGLPAESDLQKPRRQGVGPAVEIGPGQAPLAMDLRRAVRNGVGHRFPDVGVIPLGHGASPRSRLARLSVRTKGDGAAPSQRGLCAAQPGRPKIAPWTRTSTRVSFTTSRSLW